MFDRPTPRNPFVAYQNMPGMTGHLNPGDYGIPNPNNGSSAGDTGYGGGVYGTVPSGQNPYSTPYGLPGNPATDAAAQVWGFNQALAQQDVLGGFQNTQNQIQREGMANQIGLLNAQEQQEGGYLNTDYNLGNRRLDLKGQGLAVQQAANARQPGFLTQLHDIAGRGFDLSRQENVAKNRQGNFQLFNQAVGQGNVLTGGYNVQRGELAQQLMRNQVGVNLNQDEETARYNESMAKVQDQSKMLGLDAQNLGLDREDLRNQLQRGLERLHLNTSMNVDDLYTKIMSSNLDDAIQARQRWNDAWNASDAWASMYPGYDQGPGYDLTSSPARERK